MSKYDRSTAIPGLNRNDAYAIEIPVPPLEEQERIVAKIEELFSQLDAGTAALRRVQAGLKRYRASVLKAAFEGRLVKSDIRSWKTSTVEEIYEVIGGGTPSTLVDDYWKGNIPWISSADIHGIKDIRPRRYITEEAIKNSATNLVPAGSLIVVTRVGLGKVAITDSQICFSQDSQALKEKNGIVLPMFALYYLLQAVQAFKYQSRGTTIAGVTKKQLLELPLLIPKYAEQQQIVGEIERQLSIVEEQERIIVSNLVRAELNRQSILRHAFEGKLL